ncbi:site-specific integrase [Clostridium intestinale]|uniref:site-specific integrase n=1 Tax=Clostridium intestinale TaxID=36845 RepID=UPI002DD62EE8|nr:tyrosine-type recombinase/integrase [Clostridium intestinale]WRY50720.1 tyrosine-type recombinase/integrase [Clostridium intestinale]
MASIQKRGKKYRVTLEYGKDSNGKRIRKYVTANSKDEAEKIINEFEYNKNKNLLVNPEDISMEEYLEIWLSNYVKYSCEITTMSGYINIIKNHINPHLGNIKLQKLQPIQIQQYYVYIMDKKGLSPNTVIKHHALIRKSLDYALKQQLVYRNVADAVSLPKKIKYEAKVYNKDQLKKLLELLEGEKIELPVNLAAYLGLRREEILGLKWSKINLDEKLMYIHEVRVRAGKNVVTKKPKTDKSMRTLHIPERVYNILLKEKNKQNYFKSILGKDYYDNDYVYCHEDGKEFRVNTITDNFRKFLDKNNLPKIRLHDLRHTFASILYDEGVDLKSISEVLGHSDLATTNKIYTHRFDKTHSKTIDVMNRVLSINKI